MFCGFFFHIKSIDVDFLLYTIFINSPIKCFQYIIVVFYRRMQEHLERWRLTIDEGVDQIVPGIFIVPK